MDFRALFLQERQKEHDGEAAMDTQVDSMSTNEDPVLCAYRTKLFEFEKPFPKQSLELFRVGLIPSVFVVPHFVTDNDEMALLQIIQTCPAQKWTQLKRRSLQQWGGQPLPTGMSPEPLAQYQLKLIERLVEFDVFPKDARPNHVLLNRYEPGQGIMAHKDGLLYHPQVAIISLGSPAVMHFFERLSDTLEGKTKPAVSVFLPRCSLLVFNEGLSIHNHEFATTTTSCRFIHELLARNQRNYTRHYQ